MRHERDSAYLLDMLGSARLALSYMSGMDRAAFVDNIQCQDSVVRRLEIIGEAARHVSEATREALPALPWHQIIGMRNLLIHDYADVDFEVVWDTVHRDLPRLIAAIAPLVPPES